MSKDSSDRSSISDNSESVQIFTIAQILSINTISKKMIDLPKLLKKSMALHYGTDHVWCLMDREEDSYVCGRMVRTMYDYEDKMRKIIFLDTPDKEVYCFRDEFYQRIGYVSSDAKFIYACGFGSMIYQYELRDDGYYLKDSMEIQIEGRFSTEIIDNFVFINIIDDDSSMFVLVDMTTMTLQILPYFQISFNDLLHNFFYHHHGPDNIINEEVRNYLFSTDYIVNMNDIYYNDRLTYHSYGKFYSAEIFDNNIGGLDKNNIYRDNLISYEQRRYGNSDMFKVLNLKLRSSSYIEGDTHIIAKGVKLPVNMDKLKTVPMYQDKIRYQGHEDNLILHYDPELVAVFIDLLHYHGTSECDITTMLELLNICDYVGCDHLKTIIYDEIYYSCLEDSGYFVKLLETDIHDDILDQIMSDVCLIHYRSHPLSYEMMKKALDELYDYNHHYQPKSSFRKHYFIENSRLPWLWNVEIM